MKFDRTTALYLLMVAVGTAALWAIFSASGDMKAPPDISGTWELRGAEAVEPISLHIEQSGRFLEMKWDQDPPAQCKLVPQNDSAIAGTFRLEGLASLHVLSVAEDGEQLAIERPGDAGKTIRFVGHRRDLSSAAGSGSPARAPGSAPHHLILRLLGQIVVILALSQVVGRLFLLIQQPKVIGEMIAGIMLGPSLLGWVWPEVSQAIFAPGTTLYLNILSQVGVVFFLFLIGLELDPRLLQNQGRSAVVVSHASILAPFVFGGLLTIYLYPLVFTDTPAMRFSSATLFMGAAMSVTAFPVLARILTDRNLHKTSVGALTIACAAVDDVTAWCILAFVVGFVQSAGLAPALTTAGLSIAYVLTMLFFVRPLLVRLERIYERQGKLRREMTGLIFLMVLASAATTEAIGIHALFGAFLMGAIMPKGSKFVHELNGKIEDFTVVLLLPVFFAYTGLHTHIGLINSRELWMLTGLIVLVACAGKFGGSLVAARVCGMGWRQSSAIGILMNTRGLMELVILNIGRELGVITDAVFAMMVIMAIVTTFLTTPVLNLVYPDRLLRDVRRRERSADAFGVLLAVSLPKSAKPLLRLAEVIAGTDDARRHIIGLNLRRADEREAYRAAVDHRAAENGDVASAFAEYSQLLQVPVETMSFVSRDAATDIVRIGRENRSNLILMGYHNPVIGQTFLGGTVHRVLEEAASDVGIFVDRGLYARPKTVLVPYLGTPNDRLALETAARIGRNSGAAATVLHFVGRDRGTRGRPAEKLGARNSTEQVFSDPTQPAPVKFMVIEDDDPIAAILSHAASHDLVVIGISEQWGLTSRLFGWRAERIARDCPSSLLMLKRNERPVEAGARLEPVV